MARPQAHEKFADQSGCAALAAKIFPLSSTSDLICSSDAASGSTNFGATVRRSGAIVCGMNLNEAAQINGFCPLLLRAVMCNADGPAAASTSAPASANQAPPFCPRKNSIFRPSHSPSTLVTELASTRISSGDPATTIAGVKLTASRDAGTPRAARGKAAATASQMMSTAKCLCCWVPFDNILFRILVLGACAA